MIFISLGEKGDYIDNIGRYRIFLLVVMFNRLSKIWFGCCKRNLGMFLMSCDSCFIGK